MNINIENNEKMIDFSLNNCSRIFLFVKETVKLSKLTAQKENII